MRAVGGLVVARASRAVRLDGHGGWLAHVAQSVERVLGKDEVTSSNLVVGSMMNGEGRVDRGCGSYGGARSVGGDGSLGVRWRLRSSCGKAALRGARNSRRE